MLTPELEREVLAIRCQMRQAEIKETFVTCSVCNFLRPAAPTKQRLCVDCYAKTLERAVHVAEASVGEVPKRKQHDPDLFAMYALGMGVVIGFAIYWIVSQWN